MGKNQEGYRQVQNNALHGDNLSLTFYLSSIAFLRCLTTYEYLWMVFFSHHNFWIICLIYSTYLLHYIIILYSSLPLMIRWWWGLNYCPTGCSVLYKLSFTPFLDLIVIKANVMWLGRVRTFQLEPGTHMAFKPREKFRYWPFFLPFHASIYCMTNILEHAALH